MNQFLNFFFGGKELLAQCFLWYRICYAFLRSQNKALLFVLTTSIKSW